MGEKVNLERLNIIGLILLLFGLGFVGFAVTGKAISNGNTLNDYCNLDIECVNGKICCVASGAIGMCQTQEICDELKADDLETPAQNSGSYVGIGINLIIFAAIIFIIAYMAYRKESRAGRGNSKSRRFKRRK